MFPIAPHLRAAAGRFPSSTVRGDDCRMSRSRSVGCLRRLSGSLRGRLQRRQRMRSRSIAGSLASRPGSRPAHWHTGASTRYRGRIRGLGSRGRWPPCRASARRRPCGHRACAQRCGGIRSRRRHPQRPRPGRWRRRALAVLPCGHAQPARLYRGIQHRNAAAERSAFAVPDARCPLSAAAGVLVDHAYRVCAARGHGSEALREALRGRREPVRIYTSPMRRIDYHSCHAC